MSVREISQRGLHSLLLRYTACGQVAVRNQPDAVSHDHVAHLGVDQPTQFSLALCADRIRPGKSGLRYAWMACKFERSGRKALECTSPTFTNSAEV